MKKKSASQSAPARRSLGEGGFFKLRVLLAFVFCLTGALSALGDPPDTNEYYQYSAPQRWHTRVGKFPFGNSSTLGNISARAFDSHLGHLWPTPAIQSAHSNLRVSLGEIYQVVESIRRDRESSIRVLERSKCDGLHNV
jgi:hypothetical protein